MLFWVEKASKNLRNLRSGVIKEFHTLEQLLTWIEEIGEDIIISLTEDWQKEEHKNAPYTILIYDDYIE